MKQSSPLNNPDTNRRRRRRKKNPLTLHDVPFVVAVVVAVSGPVVNVESLNRGVVVARRTILHGGTQRERERLR